MDLEFGPEYDRFEEEVDQFLSEQARDTPQRDFLRAATERGYLYRHIPKRFGGSEQPFDPIRETIVAERFDASGLPWRLGPQSTGMIVPTLLEAGAEWQVAGTHFKELTGTVGGLQPGTAYMFRARGVTRDFWTAWGPPSAGMVTLACTSGSKVESMACTVS